MNVFIAVWIIVAAEKDEARPDKETRRAVHYNRSWSRWRTDRSRCCRQKIHRQSGCIVRDHIPINFRLWKASNLSEERDAVREKKRMVLAGV